ncbi:MAG TPA: mevalonate kinase [Anaerolineae bacterium]|nr:mevalonate kinase [Anaerolineae bacterium]
MTVVTATASGKIILFGEHAVVYGQPAIAAPVTDVRATVQISPPTQADSDHILFIAPDLGANYTLDNAPEDDALARAVQLTAELYPGSLPPMIITVSSDIPIASGLGSGAAMAAAMFRALGQFLHLPPLHQAETICQLTYEIERIHHGTPSGIDNTVVTYEQPVFFQRQQPTNRIDRLPVGQPLTLLIADTGQRSATKDVVGDVRRQWEANPAKFNQLFTQCGQLTLAAQTAIAHGQQAELGHLLSQNHALLQQMSVSNEALDRLVAAAAAAGALGAKLSGAGRGGNMIALVTPTQQTAVQDALYQAGATNVIPTTIHPTL